MTPDPGWSSWVLSEGVVVALADEVAVAQVAERQETWVLARAGERWQAVAASPEPLSTVARLADGSWIAAGPTVAVHGRAGAIEVRDHGAGSAPGCLWGAAGDRVHALFEGELWWFDGVRWQVVELSAQGIEGTWAHGACDASGRGWIVGTHGTHSCMATGAGPRWTQGGCGSWYLYRVAVDDAGSWFAAGGDGLWRRVDGRWEEVAAYRRGGVLPVAMCARGGAAIVVGVRLAELAEPTEPRTLEVFVGGRWRTLEPPPHGRVAPSLTADGRLRVVDGATVWESGPLTAWA